MNLQSRHSASLAIATILLTVTAGIARPAIGTATLMWTAPGDDSTVGRASAYQVRYSILPITPANFTAATVVVGVPAPKTAGSRETLVVANLPTGTTCYFAIKTVDKAGNWSGLSNIISEFLRTTAIRNTPHLADFSSPWPSPARSSAHWSYSLPVDGPLEAAVFDVAGRRVRELARGWTAAGEGQLDWNLAADDGRSVPAGIYLVRAELAGQVWTRRLVVVR